MNQTESKSPNLLSSTLTILSIAALIVTFLPVWRNLIRAWSSFDESSQGFLIVPLAGYLAWRKKSRLGSLEFCPSNWGLVLIVVSLLCYLFAHFAQILTLESFSMILSIAGMVLFFFGTSILKELSFPIFFLVFMIPVPSQIYSSLTIPLQLFVSKTSVGIARLVGGVPIYRDGNVIHLPDRSLQVVQACSGLRSMIALLTLSAVFGYLSLKSNFLRFVLFLSGVPVAVFVNLVRILLMVLAIYYAGFDLTREPVHAVFGVLIFGLAFALIFAAKGALSFWDSTTTNE